MGRRRGKEALVNIGAFSVSGLIDFLFGGCMLAMLNFFPQNLTAECWQQIELIVTEELSVLAVNGVSCER